MTPFAAVLFGIFCLSSVAHATAATVEESYLVRNAIPEAGKCRVNICFALQGSRSLTGGQFFSQKRFILKVVKAISARNDLNVSAVEYGLENNVISQNTSNIPKFISLLRGTRFTRAPTNFVSGGLLWCQGQLRGHADDPDKIVLLGTGKADFGGDPVPRARPFLESGGDIFALGVGNFDRDVLTEIVGGDGSLVFKLGKAADDDELLPAFLSKVCGNPIKPETPTPAPVVS